MLKGTHKHRFVPSGYVQRGKVAAVPRIRRSIYGLGRWNSFPTSELNQEVRLNVNIWRRKNGLSG